jgi:hypothetical protein
MMDNKEEKLKKILFNVIDKLTENTDVYHHNGSMWLINTKEIKWVFEFTKRKTLWYNHEFFRAAFKFVSLEVTHNRYFITEWFESRFLNKPKVKQSNGRLFGDNLFVNGVIQDGVKRATTLGFEQVWRIEDTIQNGVKDTLFGVDPDEGRVEDAIQNGVKDTEDLRVQNLNRIEDTIQNGVKSTRTKPNPLLKKVEDTIKNGVKDTQPILLRWKANVEETIENGVKGACYTVDPTGNIVEVDIQDDEVIHTGVGFVPDDHIEDTIQNGVKPSIKN